MAGSIGAGRRFGWTSMHWILRTLVTTRIMSADFRHEELVQAAAGRRCHLLLLCDNLNTTDTMREKSVRVGRSDLTSE